MNIDELFDVILQQGCGVDLASYQRSKTFRSYLKQQKDLFDKNPENTDQGIMLRSGHLAGGVLLNCYPEQEAIELSRQYQSPFGHGIDMRAKINYTGTAIVKAAKKQLPIEAYDMARRWKSGSADEQLAVTKELYHLFNTDSQRVKNNITIKNIHSVIREKHKMKEEVSGSKSVLPLVYGKWDKKKHFANCQGKTQMIVAFARMVGAKVLLMFPNDIARDVVDNAKVEAAHKILQDIENRKIAFPDQEFMGSTHATIIENEFSKFDKSFHLCPVLQLSDGRWVVIDSNAMNWGVMGDAWQLDSLYSKLEKYADVLPGLSLGAADYEQRDKAVKMIWEKFDPYLEHSRKLEEELKSIDDLTDIVEAIEKSESFAFIANETFQLGEKQYSDLPDEVKKYTVNLFFLGPDPDVYGEFLRDPKDFLAKKLGCIYTYYHCLAADAINDYWNDEGIIIHPEAHFTICAEYHIALSALNSLATDNCTSITSPFIADYSFCQTTLHNAMLSKMSSPELAVAARNALEQLPYKHRISERFLKYKKSKQ
ncbi:MAG TPA: hypothetical protein PK950_01795 [Candidatus Paceibacterota bacterium]|nr:hypothetical protein [Candidatus Paceibacterota bacterium]